MPLIFIGILTLLLIEFQHDRKFFLATLKCPKLCYIRWLDSAEVWKKNSENLNSFTLLHHSTIS